MSDTRMIFNGRANSNWRGVDFHDALGDKLIWDWSTYFTDLPLTVIDGGKLQGSGSEKANQCCPWPRMVGVLINRCVSTFLSPQQEEQDLSSQAN